MFSGATGCLSALMPPPTAAPRRVCAMNCRVVPTPHATEKRQTAYYSIAFQRSLLFSLLRWALSQKNRPLIYSLACILLKTTSFFTFTMLPVCWLRLTANICNLPVWTSACGGVPWHERHRFISTDQTGLWMEGGGTSGP